MVALFGLCLALYSAIVTVYDQEITFPISVFFTFVLAMCNLNYSVDIRK